MEFIPCVAHSPLYLKYLSNAKKKDNYLLVWSFEALQAFEDCNKKLAEVTLLAFPNEDVEIRSVPDASELAMGSSIEKCELMKHDGSFKKVWRSLAFFLRKFNNAQQKYSTYDRELMAISESVKHFHYFLESRRFQVCIDHKPIIYSQTKGQETAPAHRVRRVTFLSEYSITHTYLPG